MAKDFSHMEHSDRSTSPSIHDISQPSRRTVLRGSLGVLACNFFAPWSAVAGAAALTACPTSTETPVSLLGFKSVSISTADVVLVPEGYSVQVIAPWGDPVGLSGEALAFKADASSTAAQQETQFGMHHDGMHYFAQDGSRNSLLAINHEYTDEGLLFPDGMKTWTADKVRKGQAAHGVSICEVKDKGGQWQVVKPSPWGTYLTAEENFINYFNGGATLSAHEKRWGLKKGGGGGYRWHEHDARFVDIDPYNPSSRPIERSALGRAAHEGATTAVTPDGRVVVYMGEDARFEYIYKFVSRDTIKPGGFATNATLLDHGTLYVARFAEDGTDQWLPLTHGQGPLTAANGFAD